MTAAQVEVSLTSDESTRRDQLEAVVDRGLETFVEVGQALVQLREWNLYRSTHGTFSTYVKDRFGLGTARAYRIIEAAKIADAVSPMGDIRNERQARELTGLSTETAQQVYMSAVEATDGRVTAAALRQAREQIAPKSPAADDSTPQPPVTSPPVAQPPAVQTPPEGKLRRPKTPVHEQTDQQAREISNRVYSKNLAECVWLLAGFGMHKVNAPVHAGNWDATQDIFPEPLTPARMRQAATYLNDLADAWEAS